MGKIKNANDYSKIFQKSRFKNKKTIISKLIENHDKFYNFQIKKSKNPGKMIYYFKIKTQSIFKYMILKSELK